MKNITIYNKSTGVIDRHVTCPEYLVELQYDVASQDILFDCDQNTTHIINGEAVVIEPDPIKVLKPDIRIERNKRLQTSDWTQLPDAPLSLEKKQAWSVYRQQLRDFPDNCDINNPIWPSMPIGD